MSKSLLDSIVDCIAPFNQPYTDAGNFPKEPEQVYLLGHRFADYGLALGFAFAFPLLRAALTNLVFTPCGKYLISRADGKKRKVDPERLRKWNESCWKLTVYLSFTTLAFLVSYKELWFTDSRHFWLGCSHFPPCNLFVTKGVLLFYCIQTGFYVQAIHFLIFHEVRRKDWLESMLHHVVTTGLLAYSYYVNFTRVGIMIMLLHDISDIFLETAKLAWYCRQKTFALVGFIMFFVSWVLLRLVYYPLVIIRSTLSEPITLVVRPYGLEPMPHYFIFNALLLVLLVLHAYWTWLILQVLIRIILTSNNSGDVREGDMGDDSDKDD